VKTKIELKYVIRKKLDECLEEWKHRTQDKDIKIELGDLFKDSPILISGKDRLYYEGYDGSERLCPLVYDTDKLIILYEKIKFIVENLDMVCEFADKIKILRKQKKHKK
jgi:hypothetical protein